MNASKVTLGITAMLAIFAITTATASAIFIGGATSGRSRLRAGRSFNYRPNPGAPLLISSKAIDTWRIQDSKKEQNVTKQGAHLDREITFSNVTFGGVPATVNNPITIQETQSGRLRISKRIIVTIPLSSTKNCKLILEPASNEELSKVTYTNVETKNLEVETAVSGVTDIAEPAAECAAAGLSSGKEGTIEETSIEEEVTIM
jgi:hypothetical protein